MLPALPPSTLWPQVHAFMMGSTFSLSLIASILFLRFYRKTRDRLFLFFAGAFAIMGVNRVFFLLAGSSSESQTSYYTIRLLAFLLILYAIIDKNRGRGRPTPPQS